MHLKQILSLLALVSAITVQAQIVGHIEGHPVTAGMRISKEADILQWIKSDIEKSGCTFKSNCIIGLKLNSPANRFILEVDSEIKVIQVSKTNDILEYKPSNLIEIMLMKTQRSGIIPKDFSFIWDPSVEINATTKQPALASQSTTNQPKPITQTTSVKPESSSTGLLENGEQTQQGIGEGSGTTGFGTDGNGGEGPGGYGLGDDLSALGHSIRAKVQDKNLCPRIEELYKKVVQLGDAARKRGYGKKVNVNPLIGKNNLSCGYNKSQGKWFKNSGFICHDENECLNSGSTLYERLDDGNWGAKSDQGGRLIYRKMTPKERYLNRHVSDVIGDMVLIPLSEGIYIQAFFFNETDFPFYYGLVIAE